MNDKPIIIIGASARAAAFSGYRAGYTPYWIDRFGDEDLKEQFNGQAVKPDHYPDGIIDLLKQAPDAPVMYTGAMENHVQVLEKISDQYILLGNPQPVCTNVRDPLQLAEVFQQQEIPYPEIQFSAEMNDGEWLLKPTRSAGGIGIERFTNQSIDKHHYLQEYIPGDNYSAVFVGSGNDCHLLGVTQQLIGLSEFHAGPFSYCGSIGPIALSDSELQQWLHIGKTICHRFTVKGLFGVDAVRQDKKIYPIEINPRYTASVEVIELGIGYQAIQLHCDAFLDQSVSFEKLAPRWLMGKACLFAPDDLVFNEIPATLHQEGESGFFSTADVPAEGTEIKKAHPVLTIIVSANDQKSVIDALSRVGQRIYEHLGMKNLRKLSTV